MTDETIKLFAWANDIKTPMKSISIFTINPSSALIYEDTMNVIKNYMDTILVISTDQFCCIQFIYKDKVINEKVIPFSNIKYTEANITEYKEE